MKRAFILTTILFFGLSAGAVTDAQKAVADKVLTNFLSEYVYELTKPVYVWNWFTSSGRDPIWQKQISASDPAGYAHLQSMSQHYWQSFCSKNAALNPSDCGPVSQSQTFGSGNIYGPGLYAAVDPVATSNYGGGGTDWVVMQIRLPKGYRIMNLQRDNSTSIPLKVLKALQGLNCPSAWMMPPNYGGYVTFNLNGMLSSNSTYMGTNGYGPAAPMGDECLLELRHVLKDILKIDGFSYSYSGTDFNECKLPAANGATQLTSNPSRQDAFVLANTRGIAPADVKVFTSKTSDAREDRVRLQSFFYLADGVNGANSYYQSLTNWPGYPNYRYSGSYQSCNYINGQQTCAMTATLCPNAGGNCVQTPLPPLPAGFGAMVPKMTAATLPMSQKNVFQGLTTLLWADLEGAAPDSQIGQWAKDNLFGCSSQSEYDSDDDGG